MRRSKNDGKEASGAERGREGEGCVGVVSAAIASAYLEKAADMPSAVHHGADREGAA